MKQVAVSKVGAWVWVLVLAIAGGCGDDDDPPAEDMGPVADMAPGEDLGADMNVDTDASTDPVYGACQTDADCGGGTTCFNPLGMLDLGQGHCTIDCTADADCAPLAAADGAEYACNTTGARMRCMRSCTDGFGCPEGSVCLDDQNVGGTTADICFDLSNDDCTSDSDCESDQYCIFVAADRERLHAACFTPLTPAGAERTTLLRAGEACDPRQAVGSANAQPCTGDADCPTDWNCTARPGDMREVCTAPDDQTCARACLNQGVCDGLCDVDADCPSNMRCSRFTFAFPTGTEGAVDDEFTQVKLCTYADGSRTSCARDADCVGTGAGGTDEMCWATPGTDGAAAPICVTTPPDMVTAGMPCGDDPTTAEVELRVCSGSCIDDVCRGICGDTTDCTGTDVCTPSIAGIDYTIDGCTPVADCTTNADCTGGEVCRLYATNMASAYGLCGQPLGDLAPGAECDPTASLQFSPASERCDFFCGPDGGTSGRCSTACVVDADCPADSLCSRFSAILHSSGTPLDVSDDVALPDRSVCSYAPGSRTSCATSADCPAAETCVSFAQSDGARASLCVTNNGEGAELGQACSATAACADRYSCLQRYFTPATRYCTAVCASDADCSSAGLVCRRFIDSDTSDDPALCLEPDDPRGAPLP